MNRFFLAAATLLCSGAALGACGGVSGDSLFGAGGASPTSSGSSTSTSTGETTSGSSSGAGTSSGASSTSSSSSTSTTSSSTSTSSTSSSTSSTSGTALPPVYCAGSACAAGDICCYNPSSPQPPDHCGQHGQCGTIPGGGSYTEISCSGPADCPGSYCCADFMLGGNPPQQFREYTGISCQASCANTQSQIVVCDPTAANDCPFGGTCIQSTLLGAGYYVCN